MKIKRYIEKLKKDIATLTEKLEAKEKGLSNKALGQIAPAVKLYTLSGAICGLLDRHDSYFSNEKNRSSWLLKESFEARTLECRLLRLLLIEAQVEGHEIFMREKLFFIRDDAPEVRGFAGGAEQHEFQSDIAHIAKRCLFDHLSESAAKPFVMPSSEALSAAAKIDNSSFKAALLRSVDNVGEMEALLGSQQAAFNHRANLLASMALESRPGEAGSPAAIRHILDTITQDELTLENSGDLVTAEDGFNYDRNQITRYINGWLDECHPELPPEARKTQQVPSPMNRLNGKATGASQFITLAGLKPNNAANQAFAMLAESMAEGARERRMMREARMEAHLARLAEFEATTREYAGAGPAPSAAAAGAGAYEPAQFDRRGPEQIAPAAFVGVSVAPAAVTVAPAPGPAAVAVVACVQAGTPRG